MSWSLSVHGKGDALLEKITKDFDRAKTSYAGTPEGDSIESVKLTLRELVASNPDKTQAYSIEAYGSVCNGVPSLKVELKPLYDFAG